MQTSPYYVAVETATHKARFQEDPQFLNLPHFLFFLHFLCFLHFLRFIACGPNSSTIATAIASIALFAACAWRLLLFPRIEKIKCAPPTVVA